MVVSEVQIRVLTDIAGNTGVSHYSIQRRANGSEPFEEIGIASTVTTNPLTFNDVDVETNLQPYQYQIVAIDSCGDTSITSNLSQTMHLTAFAESNELVNIVQWTPYIGWDGQIVQYELYRRVNDIDDPNPIAILPPTVRTFEDDVSNLLNTADGQFCIYVIAVESPNGFGISEQGVIQCRLCCARAALLCAKCLRCKWRYTNF